MSNENGDTGDGGDGGGDHWSASAPEFARGWDQVKNSDTQEDFYNRVGELRSHVGNSIRIPGDDASAEDVQAFHTKLQEKVPGLMATPDMENEETISGLLKRMGKPDDVSGYSDVSGEELTFNDGQLADMKTLAHDLGLTKKQFEKLANKVGGENFKASDVKTESNAANIKQIQTEWGLSAEAKYQETVNFAKAAGAPEALVNALIAKEIDAPTVFWLNSLAKGSSETTNVSHQPNNTSGNVLTPMEAQERINEMLGNPEHAYHHGDTIARKRMHEYMELANPEKYAS